MLQTLSTKRHQVTSTRVICAVRTKAVTGWPISGPLMHSRPGPWFLMTYRHKADMSLRRKRCQPSDGCVLAATLVSSSRSISLFLRLHSFTYLSWVKYQIKYFFIFQLLLVLYGTSAIMENWQLRYGPRPLKTSQSTPKHSMPDECINHRPSTDFDWFQTTVCNTTADFLEFDRDGGTTPANTASVSARAAATSAPEKTSSYCTDFSGLCISVSSTIFTSFWENCSTILPTSIESNNLCAWVCLFRES